MILKYSKSFTKKFSCNLLLFSILYKKIGANATSFVERLKKTLTFSNPFILIVVLLIRDEIFFDFFENIEILAIFNRLSSELVILE